MIFDSANFGFGTSTYEITSTLTLECSSGGGPPPWGDGSTPPRSEITQDKWEGLYPACSSFSEQGCNSYGYVYLVGNGSQQGFNTVLEETLQYVNSLGTDYAFVDQANPFAAGSARDGILTFLWFVQRYLYMARTKYPGGYQVITNSCWREAILTIWGRAWLYLDETEGISQLGINDDFIIDLVLDPELLEEINRLRDAGPCD